MAVHTRIMKIVAAQPRKPMTGGRRKSCMILRRDDNSMISVMTGNAANALMTALQNKALMGSM